MWGDMGRYQHLGEHRLDVLCAAAVEVRGSVYGRPSEPHTRLSARARRPACPRGAGARAERGIRQRVPEHLPPHCTAQAIERPAGRQRRRARKEPQARRQRLAESGGAAGCAAAPGGSEGEDGDTTERVGAALGPHEEGCSHACVANTRRVRGGFVEGSWKEGRSHACVVSTPTSGREDGGCAGYSSAPCEYEGLRIP